MEYNEWHRTLLDFTMILHRMHGLHADSVQNGWGSVKYCKKDYKRKDYKKGLQRENSCTRISGISRTGGRVWNTAISWPLHDDYNFYDNTRTFPSMLARNVSHEHPLSPSCSHSNQPEPSSPLWSQHSRNSYSNKENENVYILLILMCLYYAHNSPAF